MRKFKRSAGVVIEAPHQARVLDVGDVDGVQNCLYSVVVTAAAFVQELGDGGYGFYDRLVFWSFELETSHRVGNGSPPAVDAHFIYCWREGLAEGFVEFCAVGGAAHGV